jgi:hypothetical protein
MMTPPQQKRITYIAVAKMYMPKLAELFSQFKDKDEIFLDGSVEAVLSAYVVPVKLKYGLSASVQVWEGCAVVEDCNDVFLEGRQGDRPAGRYPWF